MLMVMPMTQHLKTTVNSIKNSVQYRDYEGRRGSASLFKKVQRAGNHTPPNFMLWLACYFAIILRIFLASGVRGGKTWEAG